MRTHYTVDDRLVHTLTRPDTFAARRAATLYCDWRYMWTGGDSPEHSDLAAHPIYRELVRLYLREQCIVWRERWGAGTLDMDTLRTFYGRARYDAWRTYQRAVQRGDTHPDALVDHSERIVAA